MEMFNYNTRNILNSLNITDTILLGEGSESQVYTFTEDKVVKIHKLKSQRYLEDLKNFYDLLPKYNFPFDFPMIYEINMLNDTLYTIEKRLLGKPISLIYKKLDSNEKRKFLRNFLSTIDYFKRINLDLAQYGQIASPDGNIQKDSWVSYIRESVTQSLVRAEKDLQDDGIDIDKLLKRFNSDINEIANYPNKNFVHGDYYLGNILVNESLEISAILDVSQLSTVGDFRMDVTGALVFLNLYDFVTEDDINYFDSLIRDRYGDDVFKYINFYKIYYSIFFSVCKPLDFTIYLWSLKYLKEYSNY